MLIKTLLNKVEQFKSFVYGTIQVMLVDGVEALVIDIEPRRNSQPVCPECGKRRNVYDRQPQRLFEYLPVLTFKSYYRYAPRRVDCPTCGVKVEALPWGYGKERITFSYQVFLARWAKRLSWKETAEIFETSWDTVFRAVKFVVDYSLSYRMRIPVKLVHRFRFPGKSGPLWIGISGTVYSGTTGPVCSGTGGPLCSGISGRMPPEYAAGPPDAVPRSSTVMKSDRSLTAKST
jgi:hypothetical protein